MGPLKTAVPQTLSLNNYKVIMMVIMIIIIIIIIIIKLQKTAILGTAHTLRRVLK